MVQQMATRSLHMSPSKPATWITPSVPPPSSERPVTPTKMVPKGATQVKGRRASRARRAEDRQPTPERLSIKPWPNPLLQQGTPASGFYAERYYGPIVGPTCLLLLRTLTTRLETDTEGFSVDTSELAASIGCSARGGLNSQFWKAVRRGGRFGLINQVDDRIAVRTELSQLTARMVQRLPSQLRSEHRVWTQTGAPSATPLFGGSMPSEPVPPIEVLRLAARGLCTPAELRSLDRAHKFR